MKKSLFFFLLCLLAFSATAQQAYRIIGTVTERNSRERIPYVSVAVWNSSKGTQTDSLGRFSITGVTPGMYRLQVSGLGYKTVITPE